MFGPSCCRASYTVFLYNIFKRGLHSNTFHLYQFYDSWEIDFPNFTTTYHFLVIRRIQNSMYEINSEYRTLRTPLNDFEFKDQYYGECRFYIVRDGIKKSFVSNLRTTRLAVILSFFTRFVVSKFSNSHPILEHIDRQILNKLTNYQKFHLSEEVLQSEKISIMQSLLYFLLPYHAPGIHSTSIIYYVI